MPTDGNFQVAFHKRIKDLSTSQEVPCYFLTAVTGGGMVLLTLAESETNSLYNARVEFSHWQRNHVSPIPFVFFSPWTTIDSCDQVMTLQHLINCSKKITSILCVLRKGKTFKKH
jgi:hypothetical protein